MKNSHKIGLLCCALTPIAFADEPASNPVSDVINITVPPIESIPPEKLVRKEEELKWDVTESTPLTTRWNNAFSLKMKTGIMSHSHQRDSESYTTTSKSVVGRQKDIDAKASSPYVGLGLSWSIGAFALTVNGQRTDRRSIGETDTLRTNQSDVYRDNVFWREDYDVSASWRFDLNPNHALSIFGGYKSSKTHYDTRKSSVPIPLPTNTTLVDVQVDTTKILFDGKGPFIGVGYAWRLSELNDTRLGLSLGYGKLKGSTDQQDILPSKGGLQPPSMFESEGTQGFRYGLYLTGPIYRAKWGELNYTLGLDAYNYTIKQTLLNASGAIGGRIPYTAKEKVLSVGGSIGYTFDL